MSVEWNKFEDDSNEIWEPFDDMREDLPGTIKHFLYSAGDRNIKLEVLVLYYWKISVITDFLVHCNRSFIIMTIWP